MLLIRSFYCAVATSLALGGVLGISRCSHADPSLVQASAGDDRMAWWREARFGMFIHWGLYAIPAGEWDGKPVDKTGEWIMNRASISVEDYEPLAARFDPIEYDPAEWAQIAADAGMKYLIITSKHHDGFCLFDSAVTEWDVVDATPHGKDLLVPLAEECRRRGVRFGVYYSILDWHHPSQRIDPENRQRTAIDPDRKEEYIDYMRTQLAELIDGCDPEVLWFDGEWVDWWTPDDGIALYKYLRELSPSLLINNRIGKGRQGMQGLTKTDREYAGDFGTPEQEIPETGLRGVDWESCMTMNNTWGFRKDDHNWKSAQTLLRNLIDTASKGGNYLLNVGPTAAGRIPAPSVERLAEIGRWMSAHGESIYGTSASPLSAPSWGRFTAKGNVLYALVFEEHADSMELPGVEGYDRMERIDARIND